MKVLFQQYQYAIIGGLTGLILAILLITVGFFKTLLVLILTMLGAYIGFYLNSIGFFDSFKRPK
ncbi:DUF2273 domain-containing protein [Enterococcus saccharolyticus]|uniref:DUF2273 domain-containing protein n=1 Tax=Candidatus Enterococcus willemsii TaxID=1857215 RepID=A0ABQ6Z251_9ENTE|nr:MULTISPECIES: DUF2273 domain-containing protein [Enterococcus]KAF1305690.1 DUF2273 domain-containing protein [Enterococcus sp. CU12B]MCD5001167.1 DUF2273 domain-containing protein [Enterococcus saccharolyticus]